MSGIFLAAFLGDSFCILKMAEMIIVLIESGSTCENVLPDIASQVSRFQETVNLSINCSALTVP